MSKLVAALLMLSLLGISGTGCQPVQKKSSGPHPWTNLKFNNDPAQFQFAIIGDRTGRHRPGVFEKGIDKLNLLRPEFVMTVGDLIEGYTQDPAEIDQQWDEIEGITAKLQAPFFYVPGNHDLSNSVQKEQWSQRFGPKYYHFMYRGVLFIAVNTYDPQSHISDEQLASIGKALQENPNARWTCLFMHEPLWDYKGDTGWNKVEQLLKDKPYTVFAGHYHQYTKFVRNDRRYLVLATMGGGLKQGATADPELGSFDHVTWVTMMPDGPRVANIELDAIHDENIRTEETANLINPVMNGYALQMGPVLARQERFDRGPVKLKFTNDAELPMKARGLIPAVGALRASPEKFDVDVPAKSNATLDVELSADKPVPAADLAPLSVNWSAVYTIPGREKPLTIPKTDLLAVEPVGACPARTSPVVIDGKLDEWKSFPIVDKANTSDAGFQFAVEHDDKNVYLAIKTIDDKSVLSPLKEPWSQDGLEIRFDGRADPERSLGRGRLEFKEILVVSMSAGETPDKMVLFNRGGLPAGVQAVCVKTPTGYAAEVAIPVSYLNERQGGAWKEFRLNIVLNDFDTVAGPLKAHWWRPDWRSPFTYSGSGTFERK